MRKFIQIITESQSPKEKLPPPPYVVDTYKRFLRLLSWGKELSPTDKGTKDVIERKYDVSGVTL